MKSFWSMTFFVLWKGLDLSVFSCPWRSTDIALDMLFLQIHTALQKNDRVVSLLFLVMSRAYDRVVPSQFLHNMRKGCLPLWIVNFILSFLHNRCTTLSFLAFLLPYFWQILVSPKALHYPSSCLYSIILTLSTSAIPFISPSPALAMLMMWTF
jgi:hypothetical protein